MVVLQLPARCVQQADGKQVRVGFTWTRRWQVLAEMDQSIVDRATWLPLQDAFTRTWFVMAIAMTMRPKIPRS